MNAHFDLLAPTPGIARQGSGDMHAGARLCAQKISQRRLSRAKGDGIDGCAVARSETGPDMTILANLAHTDEAMIGECEDRLRAARAIGAGLFERIEQGDVRAARAQARIDHETVPGLREDGVPVQRILHEELESIQRISGNRRSCRHGMPATLQSDTRFHRCAHRAPEIDTGDRAARSRRLAALRVDGEGEGRTAKALLQPGGGKPDDSGGASPAPR